MFVHLLITYFKNKEFYWINCQNKYINDLKICILKTEKLNYTKLNLSYQKIDTKCNK